MITMKELKALGANTEEGCNRCMNNEAFYLKMVEIGLRDVGFEKLAKAIEAGDTKAAFESAHALKGTMANLSLTPITQPVSELTELLRSGQPGDCRALLQKIQEEYGKFMALLEG